MYTKDLLIYIFRNNLAYDEFDKVFDKLFLTPADVAALCNTSEAVVLAWIEMGKVHSITLKNEPYIFVQDAEELLNDSGKKLQ